MNEGWLATPRLQAAFDLALALAAAVVACIGTVLLAAHAAPDAAMPDWGAYALLILGGAVLVLRRRHPTLVLVVTSTTAFVYDLLDYPGAFFTIPFVVALFSAMAARRRLQALVAAVTLFAALVAVDIVAPRGHLLDASGALWFVGWLAAALVSGEVARGRADYVAEVERRAAEAERTREEEALRRAGEERLRIARELHDVLAHSISMINVRAGVAAHLVHRRPEEAEPALLSIKEISKEALRELRATLGVLRQVDDEEAPRSPGPGLARLQELVASASAAGLAVEVGVSGEPRDVPPGVDRAAFRIVQEALTNVARHAEATRATVRLAYGPDDLGVEVLDDGRQPSVELNGGNGILGMRERAAALGGTLEAGFSSEGGFRVAVRLPLDAAP